MTLVQGFQNPVDPHGVRRWSAVYNTNDGGQVTVSTWNARSEDDPKPSRPQPALNADQLTKIATAHRWDAVISGLPRLSKHSQPARSKGGPTRPAAGREHLISVARSLIPDGLGIVHTEGDQYGFIDLVVNDGQGQSLITINAQQWIPNDPAIERQFTKAHTLTDGTKVITGQDDYPSVVGKGVVQWTVDVMRKSGLRIAVSEFNAPAYGLPATRREPPLSVKQLTSIALNGAWFE
ncbi:hypothetical protein [Streptomyces lannensis]|uniref:Uncharacterized protein n=1 Tax=Streptomyces lannensis TaxID=766498 RepID=A0ABP7LGD1_9ACTN